MLAVGLFAQNEPIENTTMGRSGLFHGGGFYFLGVQTLACVVITLWSGVISAILLLVSIPINDLPFKNWCTLFYNP